MAARLKRRRQLRVRPVYQMEAAECGVACLSMVLDAHGHSCPLSELRQRCGTSRDGNTAAELLAAARRFGLRARGLSAPIEAFAALRLPAITHWNLNHFVVLEGCDRAGFVIVDPGRGRRHITHEEADRSFSGVVLEFAPGAAFVKRARHSLSLSRYWATLRAHPAPVAFVLVANGLAQPLAVVIPAAQQVLIDHVIGPGRAGWLLGVGGALAATMLARTALGLLQGAGRAVLQSVLDVGLTHEIGARLLALPLTFIESRSHGDLLARIAIQKDLRELLSRTVQAGFDLLLIALLVMLMIAYDAELGALVMALVGLRVAVVRASRGPLDAAMSGELVARTGEVSSLAEAVAMSEMTKGFGVEAQISDRYERQVRERVRWSIACERVQSSAARALLAVGATMQASILLLGGRKVLAGEMTLGVYAGFLSIWTLLDGPIASLIDLVEGWARTRGILQRCDDILEITPDGSGNVVRERLEGHLVVRDLGFRFGTGGPWILRNVSFSIQPKEHVALVGPSGHGKTTLGKLLCGLLEPSEGSIELDGVPLRAHQRSSLARRYGVVLQEPAIIEGKVSDVLRLRLPDSSAEVMREAARVSAFDEVIERLPEQYDSLLAPMGKNLSGGERQRLAIAQAVLGAPDVLLLDEATCSLDIDLERRVMRNIECIGITVISIAHRLSVSARADRVLHVQNGSVREVSQRDQARLPGRRLDEAS